MVFNIVYSWGGGETIYGGAELKVIGTVVIISKRTLIDTFLGIRQPSGY